METASIMVVEDESIVALDLQNRLKKLGYRIAAVAAEGKDAYRKAIATRPNLVLMDIKIKGNMDGISTAELIQSEYDVPIIYITAFADEPTLQRAKLTMPYGYLIKPFEQRELSSAITMTLYRHQIEQQLKESQQWLNTTLRSIGDGVIATDPDGRIKFVNTAAEQLTGWKQSEALGNDIRSVFNINKTNLFPTSADDIAVLENGLADSRQAPTLLTNREGMQIPIMYLSNMIRNERGEALGFVVAFQDITEQWTAEERQRQFIVELKRQNDELDAFSYTIANNLTGALSPMLGFGELLETYFAAELDQEIVGYLKIIAKSGRKMVTIIDELLLLAQVRKREVVTYPLNMSAVLSSALGRLSHLSHHHQAHFDLPETWPSASGYSPWIEEVWVNYLDNAIKYGGQPPIIKVGAALEPDGWVRFWVQDNGNGLTTAQMKHLFTPFTHLGRDNQNPGGLGLSVVRRILEKLGGKVSVESQVGQGSVFSFMLPSTGQSALAAAADTDTAGALALTEG